MQHLKLGALRRGVEKLIPESVYEGNRFAPENVAELEYVVLEMNSEEKGATPAKLRKKYLDKKNI